jgi:uncharacterized protein YecA (UPF0149 family)
MSYSLKPSSLIFEQSEITTITHQLVEYRKSFVENPILNEQLENYILIANYITYIISNLQMNSVEQKVDIKRMTNDIIPNLIFNVKSINYSKDISKISEIVQSQITLIKAKLINIINALEDNSLNDLNNQNEFLKNKYQTLENEFLKNVQLDETIIVQTKIQKDIANSGYLLYDSKEEKHIDNLGHDNYIKIMMFILFFILIIFACLII